MTPRRPLTHDDFKVPPDPERDHRLDVIAEVVRAQVERDIYERELTLMQGIRTPLSELAATISSVAQQELPSDGTMLARLRSLLRQMPTPAEIPYVLVSLDLDFDDNTGLRIPGEFLNYLVPFDPWRDTRAFPLSPATSFLLMNVALAQITHSEAPLRLLRAVSPRCGLYEVAWPPMGCPLWPPFEGC